MIIDLILDRKEDDALLAAGYTHKRYMSGELVPIRYNAAKFYRDVVQYGSIGGAITYAMDYGTESDVRRALLDYIARNDYPADIYDYVATRNWLN